MKHGFSHYTPWGYFTYEKPRDKTQYYAQSVVGGFLPPVGAYHRLRDDMAYMDDYLKNRGFDYDYIRYPSRTAGYSGGAFFGSGLRSVSKNVTSLYQSDKRDRMRYDKEQAYRRGQKRGFLDGRYYYSR